MFLGPNKRESLLEMLHNSILPACVNKLGISSSYSMIVRVSVVLRRTVVGD